MEESAPVPFLELVTLLELIISFGSTAIAIVGVFVIGSTAFLGWKTRKEFNDELRFEREKNQEARDLLLNSTRQQTEFIAEQVLKEKLELNESLSREVAKLQSELIGAKDFIEDCDRRKQLLEKIQRDTPPDERDPVGAILAVTKIFESAGHSVDDGKEDLNQEDLSIDAEFRNQCLTAFQVLLSGDHEEYSIDGNTYFNAGALASKLNFRKFAMQFTEKAFLVEPSMPHKMRMLRYRIAAEQDQVARDSALVEMLELATNSPLPNCEIAISEAWNAAEFQSEYTKAIDMFEKAVSDGTTVSEASYLYVILAQLYARNGAIGWQENMERNIKIAVEKLQIESPLATWVSSSRKELHELASILNNVD